MTRRGWPTMLTCLIVVVAGACSEPEPDLGEAWRAAGETVMAHEEAIAECMAERGWEYIPTLPADMVIRQESLLAEARGLPAPDPTEMGLPEDPNDEIIGSLDDSAKEARATAYWGDLDRGGTDPGCYALTYEAAWGIDPFDPALEAQTADMEAALAADPRVLDALDDYITCMAADGIEVSSTHEFFERYILAGEALSHRLREEGESEELQAASEALDAEWVAASSVHDDCIEPHYQVEETVRAEYLREHGIWD